MRTTSTARALIKPVRDIKYRESDGKPLGETGIHVETIFFLVDSMWRHYDDHPTVAVLSNMFLYYVEGDPKRNVCPDVFVTLGVPANRGRRTFKVWEEQKCPDLIVEVTSRKTRHEDTKRKFELYRDVLKVREYILFDPLEEYLEPSLQGFRLVRGHYKPIPMLDGRLSSKVLGFDFERSGSNLRLCDPRTGLWLPTGLEMARMLRASKTAERTAKIARRAEESARHQAEAELARLRHQSEAELARLRQENEALRKKLADDS